MYLLHIIHIINQVLSWNMLTYNHKKPSMNEDFIKGYYVPTLIVFHVVLTSSKKLQSVSTKTY